MTTKKRVGFIQYDEPTNETKTVEAPVKNEQPATVSNISKSNSQIELLNKINDIASVILDNTFNAMAKEEKTSYVQTLINTVALETELDVKNRIIQGKV